MGRLDNLVDDMLEECGETDLADYLSEGDGELDGNLDVDTSFPSSIFICNIPKVGQAKYDKLMGVLSKLIDKYGKNSKHMPINPDTEQTDGFIIVTYDSPQEADLACNTLDGMSLDRTHTFKVVKLDKFDAITQQPDEFKAKSTLNTFSRVDFRDWLTDEKCREQFLLRYQTETEIYWHDTMNGAPVLCYGGEREKAQKKIWCDWRVQWSSQGSYIATFHQQGIALWAGPSFTKKMRFAHDSVKYLEFSPSEDIIVTWNGAHHADNDENAKNAYRFFRVLTGECVRTCKTPAIAPLQKPGSETPHYLWSHDGKFFAECNETQIIVRESENMEIIRDDDTGKKKAIKYEGLHTFQWSPKDNIIAAWILEKNNNPARLVLVEIPSRKELASRSRTSVEAEMHWQSKGDYLALVVTKISKTGKKGSTNLEIFRLRSKNIPVEIEEVPNCTVKGFFWETAGDRFAVLTADESGHHPKIRIYQLNSEKCEMLANLDLPSNSFTDVFWAPGGQYFVCAAMAQGDLLFGGMLDNKLEIMHKDEHFMLTDVQWDPSSRYVITAVTQPMRDESGGFKYQMEAGYKIWTFQGRSLFSQQKEKLWHISWRPHPPSLLSSDRQDKIRKGIKQYSKKYDALDDQAKEKVRQAFRKDREEKMNIFKDVLDRLHEWKDDKMDNNGWLEAWDSLFEGQEWNSTESHIEEELEQTEEVIS